MPTVDVLYESRVTRDELASVAIELRGTVARLLSGKDIQLKESEVSVRLISADDASQMIADIEVTITAYSFAERVERKDEICNQIRSQLMDHHPRFRDIRVWLALSTLGHSW